MPSKKSSTADTERLDDQSIERAIKFLEDKGTKKGACEILGIKYNTTRLDNILTKYIEKKNADKVRRAEKRGKPATPAEISYIVSSYLEGNAISNISDALYRTPIFVRNVLDSLAVPIRRTASSYFDPPMIPDDAVAESFKVGDRVYSARYDSLAIVIFEYSKGVYRIWLEAEKWKQFAYQPAYELASLAHLSEYISVRSTNTLPA